MSANDTKKQVPQPTDDRATKVLERVDKDIDWYDRNAKRTMRLHHTLGTIVIVAASLVSIFALTPGTWAKYVAAALGALAGIARGLESFYKYNEKYTGWRFTAEQLKREKYEYEVGIGPYSPTTDKAEAIDLLATRVEDLTSQENQQWLTLQQQSAPTPRD